MEKCQFCHQLAERVYRVVPRSGISARKEIFFCTNNAIQALEEAKKQRETDEDIYVRVIVPLQGWTK